MQRAQYLGFGLGLRPSHYQEILETHPHVDWLEIMSEDYLVPGGNRLHYLDAIRECYPVVMHGVSMSIGSSDPLDWGYLRQLKQLIQRINPCWVSDHLCWTGINGTQVHDLLPLPFTEEAVMHVAERVSQVQDYLQRQILLENVSSYVTYNHSEMTEWDFIRAIAEESNCLVLLDINNIYVSAFNHHFDPIDYLHGIPVSRVQQFHMAGHSNCKTHIVDTHDHDIIDPVWDLYAKAIKRFGYVSTLIERDDHIPPVSELLAELNKARQISETIHSESHERDYITA